MTVGCSLLILVALLGCDREQEASAPPVRPVRVTSAVEREASETVSLSGVVEAKTEADLGFRIGGRLLERPVNVGDRVQGGRIIARLDAEDEENAARAAEADLVAAQGRMIEAETNYERQHQLLDRGFTTRQRYDECGAGAAHAARAGGRGAGAGRDRAAPAG